MTTKASKPCPASPERKEAEAISAAVVRKLVKHDMINHLCNVDGVRNVIFGVIETIVGEKHALIKALTPPEEDTVPPCPTFRPGQRVRVKTEQRCGEFTGNVANGDLYQIRMDPVDEPGPLRLCTADELEAVPAGQTIFRMKKATEKQRKEFEYIMPEWPKVVLASFVCGGRLGEEFSMALTDVDDLYENDMFRPSPQKSDDIFHVLSVDRDSRTVRVRRHRGSWSFPIGQVFEVFGSAMPEAPPIPFMVGDKVPPCTPDGSWFEVTGVSGNTVTLSPSTPPSALDARPAPPREEPFYLTDDDGVTHQFETPEQMRKWARDYERSREAPRKSALLDIQDCVNDHSRGPSAACCKLAAMIDELREKMQ